MPHNELTAIFPDEMRRRAKIVAYFLGWAIILAALFATSRLNYLLFHGLAELFSIIIACAIFTIAWNSRHFAPNAYLLIIGVSALFVAGLDLIHILAFKGMGVFPNIPTNTATQLWIAARYLQGLSLLAAAVWLFKKNLRSPNAHLIFFVYFAATAFLFLSIFYWQSFPTAYINGLGLTPFKKISEYIISAILLLSLFPLAKKDYEFDRPVFWLIVWAVIVMVLAEISFTFYIDPYGIFNTVGHLLKIISFYLLYQAVVVANFKNPFAFLFKNIKQKETALTAALKESQRVSESLKINEQLYQDALIYTQNIIDTVRQPLLVLDEHLKIDSANKSFYSFFKASPEEIEKKILPKICDCEWDNPELIKLIQKTFAINQNFSGFELAIDCQRIGKKTLLFSGQQIKRSGNRPPLALLSVDDITEKKKSEEALREAKDYLEKLIDHANAPIVIWSPQHKIIRFNYAFEQLTGYRTQEIVGRKLTVLFPEKSRKETLKKILTAAEGEHRRPVDVPILRQDQGTRTLLWSSANIYSNYYDSDKRTLLATIAQGQDITELKKIDQAKTEFISLAAHQLRTPLSTIALTAEMLLRGITNETNADTREYLKNIYEDIQNMTEMIEAFLNVSRIEMGTFPIDAKPTNLIEVVNNIINDIKPQATHKNISLATSYNPETLMLNLDRKAMRVVMENLLSNAIKYTPQKGAITITIGKNETEAIIQVADTGCGIPRDQQDKIFEKTYRASNVKDAQVEGVGLGLYVVKSILDQAGCRIWLESKENKGATFYVAMPLSGMVKK